MHSYFDCVFFFFLHLFFLFLKTGSPRPTPPELKYSANAERIPSFRPQLPQASERGQYNKTP